MSNLLTIETRFLNNESVKNALNLTEVKKVNKQITNAQKKKFESTMKLAELVHNGFDWFRSESGQEVFTEEGIEWTADDFFQKTYGFQKSFGYKLIKAHKLPTEVKEEFDRLCQEDSTKKRSLNELLKFSRGGNQETATESTETATEEVAEQSSEEVREESNTLVTFVSKLGGDIIPSVNFRVEMVDGEMKVITTNSKEDILNHIEAVKVLVQNMDSTERTGEQLFNDLGWASEYNPING